MPINGTLTAEVVVVEEGEWNSDTNPKEQN